MRIGATVRLNSKAIAFTLTAICILFTGWTGFAAGRDAATPRSEAQLSRARLGIDALQAWYNQATGLYETTGWWNSANAITVLTDYARVSKSRQYDTVLSHTFETAQKTNAGFLNNFYDDEGWWALAWIDAYDLTGERRYLTMAESIFADMAGGWDSTCGGGIWWSKDRGYKNAIANELFLSVSAHMANRDPRRSAEFLAWADKEWTWFAQSGMINSDGLVNDGLGTKSGHTDAQSCSNNGQTTWSYNQGVVLGGLSELGKLDADPALRESAERIATAALRHLVDGDGVMHDPCEPKCGADGVQFKGIFVRNLRLLDASDPQAKYESFIKTNADAIWMRAQGPGHQFGQVWSGPFDAGNAGSQSSALDAIVSEAGIQDAKHEQHEPDRSAVPQK